jgi:hypothetical protein
MGAHCSRGPILPPIVGLGVADDDRSELGRGVDLKPFSHAASLRQVAPACTTSLASFFARPHRPNEIILPFQSNP